MRKSLLLTLAMVLAGAGNALAQADSTVDTATIVESFTTTYEGQTVDYFVLDIDSSQLIFIEDSAYVMCLGIIDAGDTAWLPAATVWMKTRDPQVGDAWPGMLPFDEILFTDEEIVGAGMVTVGAGMFMVFEIGVWDAYGRYLGEKWYADGVGLVGWDLQICNEWQNLELLEYDLSGGGYWPHALGDQWVYKSRTDRTWVDAPVAAITVDGFGSDWLGLAPVVQDSPGDDTSVFDGTDIREVWAAASGGRLYMMGSFWDPPPDTAFGLVHNVAYAFLFDDDGLGNYWGYSIGYEPAPVSEWRVGGINLPSTGAQVAVGDVVEVSVPVSNLGVYASGLPYYFLAVDSGFFDVSCYNDVRLPAACPIGMTGDVQGDFNLTAADIVFLVNFVLKAGSTPTPCAAAGDVNCNGSVSSADIIYLVNRVFRAGPNPCDVCNLIPGTWTCP